MLDDTYTTPASPAPQALRPRVYAPDSVDGPRPVLTGKVTHDHRPNGVPPVDPQRPNGYIDFDAYDASEVREPPITPERVRELNRPDERFGYRPRSLMFSPVLEAMSKNCGLILLHFEREHMRRGGAHNGELGGSYRAVKKSVHLHERDIGPALAEAIALGLIYQGPKGFGMCWLKRCDGTPAPHWWERFKTYRAAKAVSKAAIDSARDPKREAQRARCLAKLLERKRAPENSSGH
ncbi:hypothetical protein SAMN05444161_3155 [Rhizobiales bacterium GAS191]|nr:hypothetical protein SAMN05444161_3155 [Rhizobiales bacterium GAS191]